ncbi:Yfh7p [Ascoidea rubescens DSM 1968]|uniref:p-loop containing nucleoside triphosphate hydrolase protein n=1 Tax=Ascoidea rubescens DSM 1968 TaxID=1344418 RepID=A0A1D2VCU2_9ASCO|nr:P-loop containing nucleoside triphosphate hydrolase protein [Ascoidea rubescens DSM 1968]ODV59392.1 P-loop containing nucleoside triphosphate hydrolase protein [Ascoidea rubescens DSM 1968]
MDSTYNYLADRALDLLGSNSRVLILLIGIPGSGKSTLAKNVVDILNSRFEKHNELQNQKVNFQQSEHNSGSFQENKLVTGDFVSKLEDFNSNSEIPLEDEYYVPKKIKKKNEIIISGRCEDNSIKLVYPKFSSKHTSNDFAQIVPMDGFHLSRKVLKQFKDPDRAILRRGSPFTFDSKMVATLIKLLASTCTRKTLNPPIDKFQLIDGSITGIPDIYVPNFIHELKDPTPFGIPIKSTAKILIIEGLYLLLNQGPWKSIYYSLSRNHEICYEIWKIEVEFNVARERVAKRHYESGGSTTTEEGYERFDINDRPNGKLVEFNSFSADHYIQSI